jgi:hypothetical protein
MNQHDNKLHIDEPGVSQPWIDDARALLDDSTRAIDAATLSRLNRARQAALAARRPRARGLWWLSAAGLAGTCALLLALTRWNVPSTHGLPPAAELSSAPSAVATVDAVTADDIEFYQNLEFYAWLDAQDSDIDG